MTPAYLVAVYDAGGLHTWEGFGPDGWHPAFAEAGRLGCEGRHVTLLSLEGLPEVADDAVYDWIDSQLVLFPSGQHDPRLKAWHQWPTTYNGTLLIKAFQESK